MSVDNWGSLFQEPLQDCIKHAFEFYHLKSKELGTFYSTSAHHVMILKLEMVYIWDELVLATKSKS
jgi:hypothetical protein